MLEAHIQIRLTYVSYKNVFSDSRDITRTSSGSCTFKGLRTTSTCLLDIWGDIMEYVIVWRVTHTTLQCAFTLLTYCGCWFPWLCIHLKSVISGHFCLQNLWWFASPLDKKLICVNRANFVHGIHLRYNHTPLYMVSFIQFSSSSLLRSGVDLS